MANDTARDQTGEQAVLLLRALADTGSARATDLAAAAGIPEAPATRLLSKLAALDLVEFDRVTALYRLGPQALRTAGAPSEHREARDVVHDVADRAGPGTKVNDLVNRLVIDVWDENLHQGYWHSDDDDSSNRVATDRLTDLVITHSDLGRGGRVLDIGCGVGVPALRLAEAAPVDVVGISNNHFQIDQANRRAVAGGAAQRVRFEYADALDLPYAADSFDVVWMVECLSALDRRRALDEARRVLRPGGRIVLTDQMLTGVMNDQNRGLIEEYLASTDASLLDADGYRALIAAVDLEVVTLIDISEHTRKTAVRMIEAVDRRHDELIDRHGRAVAPLLEMFRSPVPTMAEMGYVLVVAGKPTGS
ncbi:2-methyl-6-phytyl-1,4-benzoquinone methyltransferase / 2-methyl-6-solanyl-1,4-benzoquinone methyltransferase [Alloactinosynnema sp. L-07]|uniref:methyltransferase domain-containing protein n=1 Tax=Alloactinosynnema sp. L-07 TaxID=1653480 RepID=UPI00065F08AE|nr:methyltransferase domain-containing protein [Alloactinosynnema sp. L-07]CRK56736.1 2-methyl-6-phytyl-1,4-benzoquinone methyltransferase / 2-methyl-6-solanyl-1,4-benzoquinone methyltransferase [Alloactinosynnema sp. L-07]